MRLNLRDIKILVVISLIFIGCTNGDNHQKTLESIQWQNNSYAKYFKIGTTATDTIILIYFDSSRIIQRFHKGKNPNQYPDFTSIASQSNPQKIAVLTSAFAEFLSQLKSLNKVIAVDQLNFWTSKSINQLPLKNQTLEIQKGGNLQIEKLLQTNPDLTFTYTLEPKTDSRIGKFNNLIYIQNHFEVHPLARAEWIKVFGLFLNSTHLADSLFQQEKDSYLKIKNQLKTQKRPKVMVNLPFTGIWWVPQKNNYLTQLIYDAGGNPIWITPNLGGSNSVQISNEQALSHLNQCDILLHPGSVKNITEISDVRIEKTLNSRKPQIWQNDLNMEPSGANPYWEIANSQPHLLLKDLRSIFYEPSELPYFYRQIKFNP